MMKSTGEKIRDLRISRDMTQKELADEIGVTNRAVINYETKGAIPRGQNMRKLCIALGVSEEYLSRPEIDDPTYGLEEAPYIEDARALYGKRGAIDMQRLLEANQAMFAGGDIPQEEKDKFFDAVMKAYVVTKQDAHDAFTPNKYKK